MFWRPIHRFLLWAPTGVGAAYGGALGIAGTAASQNDAAKAFLNNQISFLVRVTNVPHFLLYLFIIVVVWVAAWVWTGEKAEAYERVSRSHPEGDDPVHVSNLQGWSNAKLKRAVAKCADSLRRFEGDVRAAEPDWPIRGGMTNEEMTQAMNDYNYALERHRRHKDAAFKQEQLPVAAAYYEELRRRLGIPPQADRNYTLEDGMLAGVNPINDAATYLATVSWQVRFDRLLKAMSEGEPHKAEKRAEAADRRRKANSPQDIDPQG